MPRKLKRRVRPSAHAAAAAPVNGDAPYSPSPPARPLMVDLMDALARRAADPRLDPADRTRQQAILDKLIDQAAQGEARAAQLLIALKREGDAAVREAPEPGEVSAEDREVLADFMRQVRPGGAP
jgi:hypothetical protein